MRPLNADERIAKSGPPVFEYGGITLWEDKTTIGYISMPDDCHMDYDMRKVISAMLARIEALQKELAELRTEAAKPRMEWDPMPGVSPFGITEAMQKARDTEAGRVPLVEGFGLIEDLTAIAWFPTLAQAREAQNGTRQAILNLGNPQIAKDFTDLREAYYAQ
jgi:hypothetical protein